MLSVSDHSRANNVWKFLRMSTEICRLWGGAQLVPIAMPTICTKTISPKTT